MTVGRVSCYSMNEYFPFNVEHRHRKWLDNVRWWPLPPSTVIQDIQSGLETLKYCQLLNRDNLWDSFAGTPTSSSATFSPPHCNGLWDTEECVEIKVLVCHLLPPLFESHDISCRLCQLLRNCILHSTFLEEFAKKQQQRGWFRFVAGCALQKAFSTSATATGWTN